jgi:CelD/BcsL family acetyltransferase involved in cellulose biosynthesis
MSAARLAAGIVTDEASLRALEPQWWDLWERCPFATPFQTPAWLLSWWRHFKPGALAVIAVRDGDRLAGLAPFYLEDGREGVRMRPIGLALSDYLDVLAAPEEKDAAAAALLERGFSLAWRSWDFEELGPGACARDLARARGAAMAPQDTCPALPLAGGPDLAGCVPARRRRQLRRARAAARRRGGMAIEPAEDCARFLADLFRLHAARWRGRGEAGVLADERVRAFHRDALPALTRKSLARCWVVRIGGAAAGAYYGFFHRDRAYAYLGGFDPEFGEESPGSILIGHAIEDALREGAGEFHFLRGGEAYKYSWGAIDRFNRRFSFRRREP